MLTNAKTNGLTKNYSLVGCYSGANKVRNSVGAAINEVINKKNAFKNIVSGDHKDFSRKALLGNKLGSMKEEKISKTKFYTDFMKKKQTGTLPKHQESIKFKRKTSIVARNKESNFQHTSGKVSIDSLNELTKSDFANELIDKAITDPDHHSIKTEPNFNNKTVTLSNLFTCLNTDKTLKDTRLNLRVGL